MDFEHIQQNRFAAIAPYAIAIAIVGLLCLVMFVGFQIGLREGLIHADSANQLQHWAALVWLASIAGSAFCVMCIGICFHWFLPVQLACSELGEGVARQLSEHFASASIFLSPPPPRASLAAY
jgi:hypothetical protein